jgi:hypothetical protein
VILLTHPANKKHTDKIIKEAENHTPSGVRLINKNLVKYDDSLQELAPSKTEFIAAENKFVEYSSTNPSEWEVYFGFVKPKMVPYWTYHEEGRKAFFMTRLGVKCKEFLE